jgi:hypothetical protein
VASQARGRSPVLVSGHSPVHGRMGVQSGRLAAPVRLAKESSAARGCCLDPASDEARKLRCAALPFPSTPASSARRLVCPVSVPSCWVHAAWLSLGPSEPNGREACEALFVPCKKREGEFCDRRANTAASSSCRHTRPRAIGSSHMRARKSLQTASGVLGGGADMACREHGQQMKLPWRALIGRQGVVRVEAYQARPSKRCGELHHGRARPGLGSTGSAGPCEA